MKTLEECRAETVSVKSDNLLKALYGRDGLSEAVERITSLLDRHAETWGLSPDQCCCLFSSPGRVELAGNHTDHNGGTVLAAAVDLDILAAVTPSNDLSVSLVSDLYPQVSSVNLSDLSPRTEEEGTPVSLLKGVAAGFKKRGIAIEGLKITLSSKVLPGSGLSSSAAFEVLIGRIFNDLFAGDAFKELELAVIGQEAENKYFGKPCGLMDQTACACGGTVFIDFKKSEPAVEKSEFSFSENGYDLFIIQTGSSHENLNDAYARVRLDMEAVARLLGKERLRSLARGAVLEQSAVVRGELGGLALLRALHFFDEQERLERLRIAVEQDDTAGVIEEMSGSGKSSCMYLQNCKVEGDRLDQSLILGYYLTGRYLRDNNLNGAVRVHGGGFAGTVLTCVPSSAAKEFADYMERFFGPDSVLPVRLRKAGACRVL